MKSNRAQVKWFFLCLVSLSFAFTFFLNVRTARETINDQLKYWEPYMSQTMIDKDWITLSRQLEPLNRQPILGVEVTVNDRAIYHSPSDFKMQACTLQWTTAISKYQVELGKIITCPNLTKLAWNTLISPLFVLLSCAGSALLMSISWFSLYRYKRGVIEVIDQLTRMHVRRMPDAHFITDTGDPISGRVLSLVAKLIDEQATRDQAEALARQHAELAQISARFAHDIRSPLTALKLAVASGVKSEDMSSLILRASRRIQDISDDLLKCAKGKIVQLPQSTEGGRGFSGRFERVNLANDVIQPLLAEKKFEFGQSGVSFDFECEGACVEALADVAELKRTVSNLVNNAVEASVEAAHSGHLGAVKIRLETDAQSEMARIRIRDSGRGISKLVSARLGEIGVTTKAGGSGLGLFYAREVMRRHAGELKVESSGTGGTEVSISLPLKGPAV